MNVPIQNKDHSVSIKDVFSAKKIVNDYLLPTQLIRYESLSLLLDCDVSVKHENHQPSGSFKLRGGVNLMHHLKDQGVRKVITFSTGNHGLSIATAAKWLGLHATIVVPENNNSAKNLRIRQTGATLIEAGANFEEASEVVEKIVAETGAYYVHPANEPHLINGVGTEFLEILEQLPDLDAVVLPVGAGSELAAATVVLKSVNPSIEIYAVQAKASPAAFLSWQCGKIQSAPNATFAGGFATGIGYALPFEIYRDALTDFALLTEEEILDGIALAVFHTRNIVEGAGAASLVAALKLKDKLHGKKVVLQFSGCNASPHELEAAMKLPAFRGESELL